MTSETADPATTSPVRRTRKLIPFNVALVLPAQLTMLAVVLAPTLIAVWLSLTDWQPTTGPPWYEAEFYWFWNFNDLWFDTRFIDSLWRTALVVVVAIGFELVIALGLALLFLDEWPWRKLAVSVLILSGLHVWWLRHLVDVPRFRAWFAALAAVAVAVSLLRWAWRPFRAWQRPWVVDAVRRESPTVSTLVLRPVGHRGWRGFRPSRFRRL